uniref:C2H2-type domain-containing protein n=1 Tax=Oryza punctata TaxID=4537 RepID=A0A0E0K8T5_ORYPU
MRIRRYAARLLASSAPSSLPPQPAAAAWCHAAADDCAICDLTRSASSQVVAPDAIKQKGHIAGRPPESELRSDARIGLAERPEDQGRDIDDGPPVKRPLTFTDAASRLEGSGEIITGVTTDPAARVGTHIANGAISGQGDRVATCLADESAPELIATGVASLVIGATAEPEVLKGASFANATVTEPRVLERVPLACEAATEQEAEVSVPGVTEGALPDGEGAAKLEITRGHSQESAAKMEVTKGISLVNEASADSELAHRVPTEPGVELSVPEVSERVPVVTEDFTELGDTFSDLHIKGFASIDNEGSVEQEVTGSGSLVNEATEMEVKEGTCIFTRAAAELGDTGRVSACSGDGDIALDEPRPPDCVSEVANVNVGNAGEAVASKVHSCRDDAESVGGSINSTGNGHVSSNSPTADEAAPPGGCTDTPSVSCLSDIVARSIGKSGRTDIICYVRRRGKRKLEMVEVKEENVEMDDSAICDQYDDKVALERTGPCESVTSTAVSVEIKIADIKRELEDNSTASKGKKKRGKRFQCEIDYCRMTFKNRAELSVHKKNTCTVKSCGRHFRSHKYLRRHQSIHNDDMPYKCPWEGCSMAFKWSWDRGEHFQVHAGKRPYKCTTPGCNKIYKFVSDFTRHKRRCKPQR